MHIQYVGFNLAERSRIYGFRVIDTSVETRKFTVRIEPEAFCAGSLKFQDGPGVSFARLQRELEGETDDSHAESHLCVGEQDIGAYRALHYPIKKASGKNGNGVGSLS